MRRSKPSSSNTGWPKVLPTEQPVLLVVQVPSPAQQRPPQATAPQTPPLVHALGAGQLAWVVMLHVPSVLLQHAPVIWSMVTVKA